MVFGYDYGTTQQIGRIIFPLRKFCKKVFKMQTVNQQFNPLLGFFITDSFPKVFKIGNDLFSKTDQLITYGVINILIRIVDKVEQSTDFFIFFQGFSS